MSGASAVTSHFFLLALSASFLLLTLVFAASFCFESRCLDFGDLSPMTCLLDGSSPSLMMSLRAKPAKGKRRAAKTVDGDSIVWNGGAFDYAGSGKQRWSTS